MTNSIYLQDIKEYFHIYIVQMFFSIICSYFVNNNGAILQIMELGGFIKTPCLAVWSKVILYIRSALKGVP